MKPFFTRVARPLLVVALLGVALTAVAYAHGSDLALIHACVNNNSGEIKIVGANETCRQNETPLDWNIQGPPGPQGIQGAPGVASPIVRGITANIMGLHAEPAVGFYGGFGVRLMSSGGSTAIYSLLVPTDYAGGDLKVREWYREHDSGGVGTAKIFRWLMKLTSTNQTVGLESSVPFPLTNCAGYCARTWTLAEASVAGGDLFWVELERQGNLGDDTMGRLDLIGVAIEYLAIQ